MALNTKRNTNTAIGMKVVELNPIMTNENRSTDTGKERKR